jgi:hypothetical protein
LFSPSTMAAQEFVVPRSTPMMGSFADIEPEKLVQPWGGGTKNDFRVIFRPGRRIPALAADPPARAKSRSGSLVPRSVKVAVLAAASTAARHTPRARVRLHRVKRL